MPNVLRKRTEQAWRLRWVSLLGCAAARAFAASLLELRASGADGRVPPSHEVDGDHRSAGLDDPGQRSGSVTDSFNFHLEKKGQKQK